MKNPNHPKKGSRIEVEPIRSKRIIRKIKHNLIDNPRDYCLFVLGINIALRAGDLVKLRVSQVQDIPVGGVLQIKEKKTGKSRDITINQSAYEAIRMLLESGISSEYLFPSQRSEHLSVNAVNRMMKVWTSTAHIETGIKQNGINYGTHTLRKTWGYWKRMDGVPLPILTKVFGHSSQAITLRYIGIQDEEVQDVYMEGNL